MRKISLVFAMLVCVAAHAQKVKVAAAANLRFILDEINELYKKANPKATIVVTLGSSGSLSQQIINGADYNFFMAADITFPNKLKQMGIASGAVKTYAFGKLVLWSSSLNTSKGIGLVTDESVKRISIAKPDVAPYGDRAVECLKYYKLFDKVSGKIVYADNIAQAAQYAATGNADVGFIALALALAPDMKDKGSYIELDPQSYKPVEQACCLLKGWERSPEAKKYMTFVLSDACKPIFRKYGFIVP